MRFCLLFLVNEMYLISSAVCIVALLTTCLRSTGGILILCNLCCDEEKIMHIDVPWSALLMWHFTFLSCKLSYLGIACGDLNKVANAPFAVKCEAHDSL